MDFEEDKKKFEEELNKLVERYNTLKKELVITEENIQRVSGVIAYINEKMKD